MRLPQGFQGAREHGHKIIKQAESWSVFDRCMSSSDIMKENVLKSCAMRAMRAKKKKRVKEWRELIGKQCKKSLQHEIPPDKTRYQISAKLDVQPQILELGLWTTVCGLRIRNYGLHLDNK